MILPRPARGAKPALVLLGIMTDFERRLQAVGPVQSPEGRRKTGKVGRSRKGVPEMPSGRSRPNL